MLFSPEIGADSVDPTLSNLICQTSTGQFLVGDNKEVRCIVGCDDFGPKTGFVLDPLIHQQCYDDDGQYCDIICRKRGADGRPVAPSIKEPGQALTKLFCRKVRLKPIILDKKLFPSAKEPYLAVGK